MDSVKKHLEEQGLKVDGEGRVKVSASEFTLHDSGEALLIVGHEGARANLLLAPESDYTREADEIGVSDESKVGESNFDDHFVIRDPDSEAEEFLTEEVRSAVEKLLPFVELEFNRRHYRLLIPASRQNEVKDVLQNLAELIGKTRLADS